MTLQDALAFWRGLKSETQLSLGFGGAVLSLAAAGLVARLDLEGAVMLALSFAALVLWRKGGSGGEARQLPASEEARQEELERRRDLIARYGHVPLSELAESRASFLDPRPPLPPQLTPEEAERARRAGLVARHGHVPLTELADPAHVPAVLLPPPPAPFPVPNPRPAAVAGSSSPARRSAPPPAPPPPAPAARPIVEPGRSWGRRRRPSGGIVE